MLAVNSIFVQIRIIVAFLLAIGLALHGYKKKSLDISGMVFFF